MTLLGGKSDNALYLVYKIELPTAIVKGTEDKQLDVERDAFAEEYNGKVITEKKVLAAGKLGRDFTIRGRPAEETGTLTIRIREYLDGKVVYAVLVASAPNRELPEGVGRFLGSLVLGDGKLRPTAPQEPEPKGTELKGWGLAIDPDNDCKFTPAEKGLTINVPGTMHDFGGPLKKFNAPRVMRKVEGDFVLTVKVAGELKPGPKSTNPKGIPYLGTGLLIWSDSANFIRLERAALLRRGRSSRKSPSWSKRVATGAPFTTRASRPVVIATSAWSARAAASTAPPRATAAPGSSSNPSTRSGSRNSGWGCR